MSAVIDRRQVLTGAAALIIAATLQSPTARASMRQKTKTITSTAIAVGEPTRPYPFELFYDLSRYLTVRTELDRELAHAHFDYFRQEEWGWTNAAGLYATLRRELDNGIGSAPELLVSGRLSPFDQWFAQHILNAWYEGFYRYEGMETRVTYEKALMWDAVRDLVPIQGLSDARYGYWSTPPHLREIE